MTQPLGGASASPRVIVEILDADPTATATGGKQGTVGLFAGSLYIHLTSLVDTSWLNLGVLTGAMQLGAGQVVSIGPSGAPPTGLRAFEVIDVDVVDPNDPMIVRPQGSVLYRRAGNGWYFMGAGQWRDGNLFGALMSDASTLIGLAGIQTQLHALASHAAEIAHCRYYEASYEDFQAVPGHGSSTSQIALETLEGEVPVDARLIILEPFSHSEAATVDLLLGDNLTPPLTHGRLVVLADVSGDAAGTESRSGTGDPRAQDAENLLLTCRADTIDQLTAGRVLVQVWFR
jgi:hypothetical protein